MIYAPERRKPGRFCKDNLETLRDLKLTRPGSSVSRQRQVPQTGQKIDDTRAIGVSSTPTILLNGIYIPTSYSARSTADSLAGLARTIPNNIARRTGD